MPGRCRGQIGNYIGRLAGPGTFRLTQYARGGGCACRIPPGELEETVSKLMPDGPGTDLLVGVEHGDDGAVVRVSTPLSVRRGRLGCPVHHAVGHKRPFCVPHLLKTSHVPQRLFGVATNARDHCRARAPL